MIGKELDGDDNDKEPKRREMRVVWALVISSLLYQL